LFFGYPIYYAPVWAIIDYNLVKENDSEKRALFFIGHQQHT